MRSITIILSALFSVLMAEEISSGMEFVVVHKKLTDAGYIIIPRVMTDWDIDGVDTEVRRVVVYGKDRDKILVAYSAGNKVVKLKMIALNTRGEVSYNQVVGQLLFSSPRD